jgi:hypothetical protein
MTRWLAHLGVLLVLASSALAGTGKLNVAANSVTVPSSYQFRVLSWEGVQATGSVTAGGSLSGSVVACDVSKFPVWVGYVGDGGVRSNTGRIASPLLAPDGATGSSGVSLINQSDAYWSVTVIADLVLSEGGTIVAPVNGSGMVFRRYSTGPYAGRIVAIREASGCGTPYVTGVAVGSRVGCYGVIPGSCTISNYDGADENLIAELAIEEYVETAGGADPEDWDSLLSAIAVSNSFLSGIETYTGGIVENTAGIENKLATLLGYTDGVEGTLTWIRTNTQNTANLINVLSGYVLEQTDAVNNLSSGNAGIYDTLQTFYSMVGVNLGETTETPFWTRVRDINIKLIGIEEKLALLDPTEGGTAVGAFELDADGEQRANDIYDVIEEPSVGALDLENPLEQFEGEAGPGGGLRGSGEGAPTISFTMPDLSSLPDGGVVSSLSGRQLTVDFEPCEPYMPAVWGFQLFFLTLWGYGRIWDELRRT